MKITIWHNIMWSRYKAVVFSSIHDQASARDVAVDFFQISETDANRTGLAPLDLSWHRYPFTLLFKGASADIPPLRLLFKIAHLTWRGNADVTILSGYERPAIWLQALILKLKGRRFAWFCDSTLYDKPQTAGKAAAKRILLNLADGVFCYGNRARTFLSHYGVADHKILTRCQAAALPRDYKAASALEDRMRLCQPGASPRYLYVGRLSPEKSLDDLLKAFRRTLSVRPQATLVLVGKGVSEGLLRDLARELAIEPNIVFAGGKSDKALFEEYSRASCLILPSYSEPWGLVVNEALSYGCPALVSHRCGCVPELIQDNKTGMTFEHGNIVELSDKMVTALDTFADIEATATTCLAHIAPFSPETAARQILDGCFLLHDQSRSSGNRSNASAFALSAQPPLNDDLR